MKKLLVTISGVQNIITVPIGSRIKESGSGSIISQYNKSNNKDIPVSDSIDTLFSQLSDSIKITVGGAKIVLILTPFSSIKPNGTGSKILFKDGSHTQVIEADESVSTLNTQLASSGGGDVFAGSFTKVNGTTEYTINHGKSNNDVASIGIFRDSTGQEYLLDKTIIDADNVKITGAVDGGVPTGTYSVNIVFAS